MKSDSNFLCKLSLIYGSMHNWIKRYMDNSTPYTILMCFSNYRNYVYSTYNIADGSYQKAWRGENPFKAFI